MRLLSFNKKNCTEVDDSVEYELPEGLGIEGTNIGNPG